MELGRKEEAQRVFSEHLSGSRALVLGTWGPGQGKTEGDHCFHSTTILGEKDTDYWAGTRELPAQADTCPR